MPEKTTTIPADTVAPPKREPRVRRAPAPGPAAAPKREPRTRRTTATTAAQVAIDPAPAAAARRAAPRTRRAPRREPRPPPTVPALWGVGFSGVGALLALVGLLVLRPVEQLANPWDPARAAVYALLVLAPAAIFWAVGHALRMGRFWLFGTAAWAAFGYVLIFVTPPAPGQPVATLAVAGFLVVLFAALTAALSVPLHALGWALFTQRARRQDLRRGVRQAALLALYAVACLGMVLFAVFNGLNALLLFVVLALAEFFFLSRG